MLKIEDDKLEAFLLKLDQEKAFDQVGLHCFFAVLEKFGFSIKFCKRIRIFYNNVFYAVKYNGFLTRYFSLKKYVKQECPISALLYVFV